MEEKNLKEVVTLFKVLDMLSDDMGCDFKAMRGALNKMDRFMRKQSWFNRKTSFYHMGILAGVAAGGYYIYKKFEEIDRELKELRNKGE